MSDPRASGAKWALAIVALAVLATLGILIAVLSPIPDTRSTPVREPPAPMSEPDAEIAPARAQPERATLEGETAEAPAESAADPSQSRTWARVWVVGSVVSRHPTPEPLTILVRPGANERKSRSAGAARASWGMPDEAGAFRIDATAAFPEGADTIPDKLTIQALRDGHLPTEIEVDVPFDLARVAAGGTLEIPVEVQLRTTCKVQGTAWTADDPSAAVEIAAFEILGGAPAPTPSGVASSAGRYQPFELALDCDGEYAVLAFREGYRPVTRVIRAAASPHLELALERGATISGKATLGPRGLEGTVQARIAAAGEPSDLPTAQGTAFAWIDGAYEWHSVSSRAGAEGAFELTGLAPAAYEVLLSGVTGVYSTDSARATVTAPASGVALVPDVCELRVTLVSGGAAAAHATVSIHEVTADGRTLAGTSRTDVNGQLVLWLRPGSRLKLTAGREHELTCEAAGTSTDVRLVE